MTALFPSNEKWKNSRNPYPFWYKHTPETPKFVTPKYDISQIFQ